MRTTIIAWCCVTLLAACSGAPQVALSDAMDATVEHDTASASDVTDGGGPDDVEVPGDAADVTSAAPLALCGQAPYSWLEPEEMGAIVDTKPLPLYAMSKELVAVVLADSGFVDVLDVAYDVEVFVLRYRTQDRGVAVEATTLVGLPVLPEGEALEAPVVAFLAGTSGFSEGCAGSLSDANALAAVVHASQGVVAVVPDYLGKAGFGGDDGLFHPYLVSEAAAVATWDGIRAANRALEDREGLSHDQRVILWGGSQGGHAAYAADRYAGHYAPEFEVVAGIATVAPSDLVAQAVVGLQELSPASVGLLASFVTLAQWYGVFDRITEVLQPEVATWLKAQMESVCFPDLSEVGVAALEDAFQPEFLAAVQAGQWEGYETWRCLFAENSPRHQSLPRLQDTPILTVLATEDVLVDLGVEAESHGALCDAGYDLTTLICDQASHVDGTAWSVREQFAWVQARLAGEPTTGACEAAAPVCCESSPEEICTPLR